MTINQTNTIKVSEMSNLSEDMKDVIRTHFNKGEKSTIEEIFNVLDDYIFWDSEEYANNLFFGLDKKTSVLIDIK